MKCINCNSEYRAKIADSKYCSTACKLKYNRKIAVSNDTDNLDTDKNDTDKLKTDDTDKSIKPGTSPTGLNYDYTEISPILKMRKVHCSGCNEPTWEDLNPCYNCFK